MEWPTQGEAAARREAITRALRAATIPLDPTTLVALQLLLSDLYLVIALSDVDRQRPA